MISAVGLPRPPLAGCGDAAEGTGVGAATIGVGIAAAPATALGLNAGLTTAGGRTTTGLLAGLAAGWAGTGLAIFGTAGATATAGRVGVGVARLEAPAGAGASGDPAAGLITPQAMREPDFPSGWVCWSSSAEVMISAVRFGPCSDAWPCARVAPGADVL